MDTALDEVELAVKDTFARFFARDVTTERVREAEPLGYDAETWRQLLGLGVLTMALPESAGGDGAGAVSLALVAVEWGRAIAPAPLLDSVSAARLLASVSAPEARSALESMTAGDEVVVLSPRPIVDGVARLVPSGAVADRIVAMRGDALVLAQVERGAEPVSPRNLGSMPLAHCTVLGEPVTLAEGDAARTLHERALLEGKVLLAAALVGIAEKSMEVALEYVKVRRAFGTLIGSFQTVSHRLADDAVEIDGARLLAYEAAWALDHDEERSAALGAMAFIFAAEVARRVSLHCLRFHGGVGFTMEHDSQLYYRRAESWPLAYTRIEDTYQELADALYGAREDRS